MTTGGAVPGPGFREPALAAQAHFRAALEAMAHPGRAVALGPELPEAPASLSPGAYALALTLLDHETPLWLGPVLRGEAAVLAGLSFHCGCPVTADPGEAAFALAMGREAADLGRFAQGTPDHPDRSTTLILQVDALAAGGPGAARLSGPGIRGTQPLAVGGLPESFWPDFRANARRFPMGVDVLLVAGGRVAALPRSTVVAELG